MIHAFCIAAIQNECIQWTLFEFECPVHVFVYYTPYLCASKFNRFANFPPTDL